MVVVLPSKMMMMMMMGVAVVVVVLPSKMMMVVVINSFCYPQLVVVMVYALLSIKIGMRNSYWCQYTVVMPYLIMIGMLYSSTLSWQCWWS